MRIVLLGPPGAGKGTQAQKITSKLNIPLISTGNMLRTAIAEGTALGQRVKSVIDSGNLVDDDIIMALVSERLAEPDCQQGFLFDGIPRTINQAKALQAAAIDIDVVLELRVPSQEIISRISGRRVHVASGRVYHADWHPPKVEGIDDDTGEPLVLRKDDEPATVRDRLKVYEQLTQPLVDYYHHDDAVKFSTIDGVGTADEVFARIKKQLEGIIHAND